jgi:hypothetical protein
VEDVIHSGCDVPPGRAIHGAVNQQNPAKARARPIGLLTKTDKSFLLLFFKKEALAFLRAPQKASSSFLKKRTKKLL